MPTGSPNRAEIGKLYEETGFLVMRRCVKMLGNHEAALDVTQWTYMRAVETGFEVRSRGEALAWLYRAATQRCLTLIRNEGNRRRIRGLHKRELLGSAPASPEGQAVDRDLLERVVAELDERTATIALLTYGQGMPTDRAAELCEVSVRTVARARSRFIEVAKTLMSEPGAK